MNLFFNASADSRMQYGGKQKAMQPTHKKDSCFHGDQGFCRLTYKCPA